MGRILGSIGDEGWHSVRDVAAHAHVSPASASRYLQLLLSRGSVVWRAANPRKYYYKLSSESVFAMSKQPLESTLEDEAHKLLRAAIGNRFYLGDVFARYAYELLDWYGGVNFVDIYVPKSRFREAAEALLMLAPYATVAPPSIHWEFVNQALRYGPVLRLRADYNPRHHGALGLYNVMKLEYLLLQLMHERPRRDFERLYARARESGLDEDEFRNLASHYGVELPN